MTTDGHSHENPEATKARTRARYLELATRFFAVVAVLALVLGLRDTPIHPLQRTIRVVAPAPDVKVAKVCVAVQAKGGGSLERARIALYSEQAGRTFVLAGEALTDASGKACIERVALGSLWVLADAEKRARASTHIVLDADRALVLELPAAARLSVRVTDELGAALKAATVLVTASDPLPFGALTDEKGAITFDWLPPGPWTVRAAAPGFESVQRAGVTADLDVALRRLAAIDVRVVTADGKPAAKAAVLIGGSSLWPARRAETDAEGLSRIRGLSAGSYDLRAERGSDVSEALLGFELARGAQETITLKLLPGRMVTALVSDGEGPDVVPDADVVLVEGGLSTFPHHGRTAQNGMVSLGPIARGAATLSARAAEFVGGPVVPVPEPLTGAVRIPLLRGGTLRGEVVDVHDRPISGASIEVVGTDRFGLPIAETPMASNFQRGHFEWSLGGPPALVPAGELGVMPGPVPPIPRAGAAISTPTGLVALPPAIATAHVAPWVTMSNGEFTARPVTPGRVRALVRHPEFVEGASSLVSVAPGGEAKVKVVLLRGGSLEGRVRDERGFPVAGVEVELVADSGLFERSTITAGDGAFAFAAVPSKVTVTVARPEDRSRVALKKQLVIAEGERKEIELVLPVPREPVEILVLNERDAPVELAEVQVSSLDPAVSLRSTLFTDRTGRAVISDARELRLRLRIEAPGFALLERVLDAAPAEVRVALDPGSPVTGRVTAVRGRRAVEGALVTLRYGSTRKTTLTDAEGGYRFANVPEGRIELSVTHPSYAEGGASVDVKRTGRLDRPFELETIDLTEPGEIEGQVHDRDGRPVEGARVAVGNVSAYLPAGALPAGVVQTDASGSFVLRGVRPGTSSVSASLAGLGRGSVDGVVVDAGRTTRGIVVKLSERAADEDVPVGGSVAVTLGERGSGSALEVVVVAVANGSEADRGGVVAGDVIRRVDGEVPTSMAAARARLTGREGTDVVLELVRAGTPLRANVRREAVRR